ncbi:hypothetical protein Tco_0401038 [Tanacetum coccineum]
MTCSKGLCSEEGIDFEESFALVACLEAVKIFVAYAAHNLPFKEISVWIKTCSESSGMRNSQIFLISKGFTIDVDHTGCVDTRKSTSGEIQFLGDKLVCWMSKKQDCTAMSSVEAKYVALSASCAQSAIASHEPRDNNPYQVHPLLGFISSGKLKTVSVSCQANWKSLLEPASNLVPGRSRFDVWIPVKGDSLTVYLDHRFSRSAVLPDDSITRSGVNIISAYSNVGNLQYFNVANQVREAPEFGFAAVEMQDTSGQEHQNLHLCTSDKFVIVHPTVNSFGNSPDPVGHQLEYAVAETRTLDIHKISPVST